MIYKIITYLATFSLAIITPVQDALIAIMVLVLCDAITGIAASMKEKQEFSSRRLKQTVVKIFLYEITILMTSLAEQHMFGSTFPIIKTTLGVIGLVELTSLVENLSRYTDNNVAKIISAKLRDMLNTPITMNKYKEDENK